VFQAVASLVRSPGAAAFAVLAGTAAALWARRRLAADDPAAWAWPMALALLAAPVIYPWYLLPLTPFLVTRATLPITVWTIGILPVYVVWRLVREGGRWIVPTPVQALEYGLLVAACAMVALWYRQQRQPRDRGQISLS
jgi:alpha-1,6-mannosyltransferase